MLSNRRQLILTAFLFATLGIRSLIPIGYMPGNLLAGEYMVMCPNSGAAALAGNHHHDHDDRSVNVDETCPIGSALTVVALPASFELQIDGFWDANSYSSNSTAPCGRLTTCPFHSRAPPHA